MPVGVVLPPDATLEQLLASRRPDLVHNLAVAHRRWLLFLVFVTYLALVLISNLMRDLSSGVSVFWLPNCVLVVAMVLCPPRTWALVAGAGLAGEVVGDYFTGIAPPAALGLGLVNVLEATALAVAYLRFAGREWPLVQVRSVVAFTTAAVTVTALTALPGGLVAENAFDSQFQRAYLSWWLGDGLGLLVGVPMLFTVIGLAVARRHREVAVLVALLPIAAVCVGVAIGLGTLSGSPSAGYLIIAAATAMVMFAGTTGAAVACLMLATVAVYTLNPLDASGPVEAQVFVIPMTVALLIMGAQVVSGRRQQEALALAGERIAELARTDELTGLLNLRGLWEGGAREVTRARRAGTSLGVLYADVDGLKQVNDSLGHTVGSEMLAQIAHVLASTFRATDLVCRIGGDEFAVVFPAASPEVLDAARARLAAEMDRADREKPDQRYRLSLSVGLVFADAAELASGEPTEVLDRVLSEADQLMYQHKLAR